MPELFFVASDTAVSGRSSFHTGRSGRISGGLPGCSLWEPGRNQGLPGRKRCGHFRHEPEGY